MAMLNIQRVFLESSIQMCLKVPANYVAACYIPNGAYANSSMSHGSGGSAWSERTTIHMYIYVYIYILHTHIYIYYCIFGFSQNNLSCPFTSSSTPNRCSNLTVACQKSASIWNPNNEGYWLCEPVFSQQWRCPIPINTKQTLVMERAHCK